VSVEIHWPDEDKSVTGEPGQSLLEIALANGIALDHACGGVCACSTCHVKVREGADLLNERSEDEDDQLDTARDVELTSRLGCQARILPDKSGRIVVEIPIWNVNLAREGAN
jgi:2Fe-2S ferredoxin